MVRSSLVSKEISKVSIRLRDVHHRPVAISHARSATKMGQRSGDYRGDGGEAFGRALKDLHDPVQRRHGSRSPGWRLVVPRLRRYSTARLASAVQSCRTRKCGHGREAEGRSWRIGPGRGRLDHSRTAHARMKASGSTASRFRGGRSRSCTTYGFSAMAPA